VSPANQSAQRPHRSDSVGRARDAPVAFGSQCLRREASHTIAASLSASLHLRPTTVSSRWAAGLLHPAVAVGLHSCGKPSSCLNERSATRVGGMARWASGAAEATVRSWVRTAQNSPSPEAGSPCSWLRLSVKNVSNPGSSAQRCSLDTRGARGLQSCKAAKLHRACARTVISWRRRTLVRTRGWTSSRLVRWKLRPRIRVTPSGASEGPLEPTPLAGAAF